MPLPIPTEIGEARDAVSLFMYNRLKGKVNPVHLENIIDLVGGRIIHAYQMGMHDCLEEHGFLKPKSELESNIENNTIEQNRC